MSKKIITLLGVIAAASVFGESTSNYEQGTPLSEGQMSKGYNSPARIDVQGSWDVGLSASFLYWQTIVDQMQYAQHSSSSALSKGNILQPKWHWRPGLKVGLGVNFDNDDWTIFTEWTHMIGKGKASSTNEPYLVPLKWYRLFVITNERAVTATTRVKSTFNNIDMTLSRPYYLGKSLTINPELGLKGFWSRIRSKSTYETVTGYYVYTAETAFSLDWAKDKFTYRNWGIGPNFGVKSNWLMGCGFKLIGESKMALVYHHGKVVDRETIPTTSTTATTYASDGVNYQSNLKKLHLIRTMLEGNIGFAWETYFDHCNWHFNTELAYSFLYFPHYINTQEKSIDTVMHGGVCTMRFDF